jgi:hypothetical protein
MSIFYFEEFVITLFSSDSSLMILLSYFAPLSLSAEELGLPVGMTAHG